jgi:hypothetical protein
MYHVTFTRRVDLNLKTTSKMTRGNECFIHQLEGDAMLTNDNNN